MSACSANPHAVPSAPLPEISVNGVKIDELALANELQYHQATKFEQVVQQAAQALVIRQLLLEQVKKQGISLEDEEQAIAELLAQQVKADEPDEDTCVRYFENNREKFMTEPLIEACHILLAAAPDNFDERDKAKQKALELIAQLQQDISLFPALAQQYSACPSKDMGGNLGQLSKGQTVAEFERYIMRMPEGLIANAVESRYGFHVVNIVKKIEGKPLPYDMVSDKIKQYLKQKAMQLAVQAYIQQLVSVADIQGVEMQMQNDNVVNVS
jgi:peptidyl-prolyl cis-trans isomerase C